ncbi:MAG: hypothetical protein ABIK67_04740, partial [candidate division WOR-3 bacterium]
MKLQPSSIPLVNRNEYYSQIFIVFFCLLILYAFIQGEIGKVVIGLIGLIFLIFSAFSVERSYYLVVFYFLITPDKGYAHLFPGWNLFFTWYLGLPLLIWLLGNWLLYLIYNQLHNRQPVDGPYPDNKFSFQIMDKLLLIFFGAFTISGILGILRGFNRLYWAWNFLALFMYSGYFIFFYSPLRQKPRVLFDFAVLCALIASLQYINSTAHFGISSVVLTRLMSEHIHLTPLALIYLSATIFYSSQKLRRGLALLFFPIVLVGLLLSQQRSLYGGVFLA